MLSFNTFISFLIQASLFSFAAAEESLTTTGHGDAWKYGTSGGIIGFIVLILDIIVFMEVLQSNRPPLNKVLWCLLVFLFPIVGMVVYWLFSNREGHRSGGYESIA